MILDLLLCLSPVRSNLVVAYPFLCIVLLPFPLIAIRHIDNRFINKWHLLRKDFLLIKLNSGLPPPYILLPRIRAGIAPNTAPELEGFDSEVRLTRRFCGLIQLMAVRGSFAIRESVEIGHRRRRKGEMRGK